MYLYGNGGFLYFVYWVRNSTLAAFQLFMYIAIPQRLLFLLKKNSFFFPPQ